MSGSLGNLVVSLSADIARFTEDMGKATRLTNDTARAMSTSLDKATQGVKNSLIEMGQAAAGAFAAFKVGEAVKDSAMLAARVETLGVVMTAVGNNAGYTGAQMQTFAKGVAAMGITTQESRNSLIKMAGTQMDLTKASQLARIAQDAAVIGNINSSEAFGSMIQGIQSGRLEILHNIGINVQFEEGYKKTAAALGKNTTELTASEKATSRMNEVLAYGTNIAGVYESSMSTAGKQLSSMARYTEELKLGMGEAFRPALVVMIQEVNRELKAMNTNMANGKGEVESFGQNLANSLSTGISGAKKDLSRLSELLNEVKSGLYLLGAIGVSPTALVGAGLPGQMVATSNSYAQAAQAIRDYREALVAVENSGGPDASDVKNLTMAKSAMEDKKIRLGEQLRIQKEAAEKKAAADKAAAAAAVTEEEQSRQHYNEGVRIYNKYIDDLIRSDVNLDAHSKKIAEIRAKLADDVKNHPEMAADISTVGQKYLEQAEAAKTLADELVRLKAVNSAMADDLKDMAGFGGYGKGLSVNMLKLPDLGGTRGKDGAIAGGSPAFSLTGPAESGGVMGMPTDLGTRGQKRDDATALAQRRQYENIMAAGNPYKEAELQLNTHREDELKTIALWDDKEVGMAQKKADTKLKVEQDYAASKAKLDQTQWEAAASIVGGNLGTIGAMLQKGNKEQFEAGKKFALASAAINTYMAASNAFTAGAKINIYVGIASAAVAAAAGMAQMAQIESQQYQARALGGPVNSGQTYLVGEKGPELFTAGASGQITSNDKLSGLGGGQSVSVTNVYQISTGVTETVQAEIHRMVPMITQHSLAAVQQAIDGGGSLSRSVGRR